MAQHKEGQLPTQAPTQDSAVHLHLKEKNDPFDYNSVKISAREDKQFERGVKESIDVKLE